MNELEFIILIYKFFGINLNNKCEQQRYTRKVFSIMQNLFFALFLHINVIVIQVLTHEFGNKIAINYATFLDLIIYLLSCALWWSIYNQRNSIRLLIQLISKVNNRYKLKNTLIYFIIGMIIYWFVLIVSSIIFTSCELNSSSALSDTNVSSFSGNASSAISFECKWILTIKEVLSHVQQLLMPFLFIILYFSICFNVIKILHFYKTKLMSMEENGGSQILRTLLKESIDVIKCTNSILKTFSLSLLWFVSNVMCSISLDLLAILSLKLTFPHIIAVMFKMVSMVGMIAILTFCADKLSQKIDVFKKALYNFKANRLFKNNLELIEIMDIVLNWETLPITIFRMTELDRRFLFNSITAIFVLSLTYYQLIDKQQTESSNCTCLQNS